MASSRIPLDSLSLRLAHLYHILLTCVGWYQMSKLWSAFIGGVETTPIPAQDAWLAATARQFGGYSSAWVEGGWISPAGDLETEGALRVDVVTDLPLDSLRTWADSARAVFSQQAILLTSAQLASSEMVTGLGEEAA